MILQHTIQNNLMTLENFLTTLKNNNKSQKTIDNYKRHLILFIEGLDRELNEVKLVNIDKFKQELINRKLKNSSINTMLLSVKSFINYLDDYEISTLDSRKIKLLQENHVIKTEEQFLNLEQQQKILDTLEQLPDNKTNARDKLMFALALTSGARKSELLDIKLSNINLAENYIIIKQKGGNEDILNFDSLCVKYYHDWIDNYRPKCNIDLLFVTNQCKPIQPSQVNRAFDKVLKKAGLPHFKVHDTRHAFTTNVYMATGDPEQARIAARHSKIETTMKVYVHLFKKEKLKAMRKNPLLKEV